MIKKVSIVASLLLCVLTMQAQHKVNSFFDELGMSRIKTEDFSPAHDTIIMVDHRMDDIIWARYIYRIIDMRYKQNYQLYFPVTHDDPDYRSLFKVITDAVIDGLPIYEPNASTIKPEFRDSVGNFKQPLAGKEIPMRFFAANMMELTQTGALDDDTTALDVTKSNNMVVWCDTITNELSFNFYPYETLVRNQLKYLIQEVVFFDKHTSRLHSKIMAIAPLYSEFINTRDSSNIMESLRESIMFWIPFEELRPYLAMQYAIPNRNEVKRVTFDEFFQKRLYTSYIVGEGNMYNRWIPDAARYEADQEKKIRQEQERIATELLSFEQDLWEY